jgi:hypothetical protein
VATSSAADEDTPFPSGTSEDTWTSPDHTFSVQRKGGENIISKNLMKYDDK